MRYLNNAWSSGTDVLNRGVIDPVLREPFGQRVGVLAHERLVLLPQAVRHDRNLHAGLQILEARRLVIGEVDLGRVQHVEHDELVALISQGLHGVEHRCGLVVQIGNQHENTPPPEVLGHAEQRTRQGLPRGQA